MLFLVYGAYLGFSEGTSRALISDVAPASRRGTALGVFHMGIGAATLMGSTLSGLLWDHVSPDAPFWFCGLVTVVAWILIPRSKSGRVAT